MTAKKREESGEVLPKKEEKETKEHKEQTNVSELVNKRAKELNASTRSRVQVELSHVTRTRSQLTEPVKAYFSNERVLTESSDNARELYNQSRYGELLDDGRVQLSLIEALYLIEKKRAVAYDSKDRQISLEAFFKKAKKFEPNFWVRYCVYKDIRNRGYIIKTALKFGADFRIYDRGVKPGEDHARWVVFPVHEGSVLTWYEFAAKNRVAHSTKKRLLIGIVDAENDVTYYEIRWLRP